MKETNKISNQKYLDIQKRIVFGFEELKKVIEDLGSKTRRLGWIQRNALISHVYSEYREHDRLNSARKEWEEVSWEYNVHLRIYELMRDYRDIYGDFPEYIQMFKEIDRILELAGKRDEFEVAQILLKWKKKILQ